MKTATELQDDLCQFTGTESYHRFNSMMRNFVLTDGTKYLAEEACAYWLMDAIASHLYSYKAEEFVVASLVKFEKDWVLTLSDGNGTNLAFQSIEFTDFPLDKLKLYVIPQDMGDSILWVILLPSEY